MTNQIEINIGSLQVEGLWPMPELRLRQALQWELAHLLAQPEMLAALQRTNPDGHISLADLALTSRRGALPEEVAWQIAQATADRIIHVDPRRES
jgi:hypothetical protein